MAAVKTAVENRLRRLRRRAWRALAWERAAPLLWPLPTLAAAFLAAAWFDLPRWLPGWLHAAVLTAFALAGLATVGRAARRWRAPASHEVDRRIEQDSGVRHRPLAVLRDKPAQGMAQALWAEHRARLDAAAAQLRVGRARPDMAAADPWGLRHLALLLLLVAAVGAQGDWRPRLAAALTPSFDPSGGAGGGAATADVWLAPPESTGLPPVYLALSSVAALDGPDAAAAVEVPAGSRLTARVSGGGGAPRLLLNGGETAFQTVDSQNYQIEATVQGGTVIAVRQRGRTLAEWPVTVVPDQPPEADFAAPPTAADNGALRIDYIAGDDYGLARLSLRVAPEDDGNAADGDADASPPIEEYPAALPAARPKQATGGGLHDLTGHPWAGLPATLTLVAVDSAGQSGESPPVTVVLPERKFAHPVARALVAERRRLTREGERARRAAAAALVRLAGDPAAFRGDVTAFLAMTAAAARLVHDFGPRAVAETRSLLWEAALRIEDGGVSQAARALRQAQQALAEALDRGASENELQALMAQLQGAMDGWLDTLEQQMRQAAAGGAAPGDLPPELAERLTDRAGLQAMMDRMREMAQTGARDAARRMLSQLQQMLEQVQAGNAAQASPQSQNQAFELMRRLREMAERQQALQDDTFRFSQQGATGGDSAAQRRRSRASRPQALSPQGQKLLERQQGLRRELGDATAALEALTGDIPRPLGRAERQMRDAEGALRGGTPDAAVDLQGDAAEALRQALQSLVEQVLRQMMGGMPGASMAQPGGAGRDPLGRPQASGGGDMDVSSTRTPSDSELQRARDILEELRRRAGETARPQLERDYIERLLRRF